LASAGENSLTPNTRTQGKQRRRGSLGRKRAWGGRELGADGSMGRTGGWGGREYGAEASMGRTGVRGRREAGADGSMGRKVAWGGREYGALGTSRHTNLHFDPQATTFLSPPGGIYLIKRPGGP
jgi:hypothetical protein